MSISKRDFMALGAAAGASMALPAWAQAKPMFDTLNMFVPAAPGGGWDGTARSIERAAKAAGLSPAATPNPDTRLARGAALCHGDRLLEHRGRRGCARERLRRRLRLRLRRLRPLALAPTRAAAGVPGSLLCGDGGAAH